MSTKNAIITVLVVLVLGLLWWNFGRKEPVKTEPEPEQPAQVTHFPKEIKKQTRSEEKEYYVIDIDYPETENQSVNRAFQEFVDDQVAQFKQNTDIESLTAEEAQELGLSSYRKYSLAIGYQAIEAKTAYTYVFVIDEDTGGAHGNQYTKTFAFDQNGSRIDLVDLFQPGKNWLAAISGYVQAELKKREFADVGMIADGAGEKTENFQNFAVKNDGIEFIFDPYQAAPYAAGEQRVLVPYSVLKPFLKAEFLP